MGDGEDDGGFQFSALILTRRLLLRPPDEGDRAAIAVLSRNPRVAENLAASPGERRGDSSGSFAVVEKDGGAVVGATACGPMPSRPASVEIATFIGEPHWGCGYATEATQALIDRIFADARILVLWCSNRASNLRARRVVEKCGFQFREAGMERSPSGRAMPVERFVLERRNWTSLKAWGAGPGRPRKDRFDAPRDNAA